MCFESTLRHSELRLPSPLTVERGRSPAPEVKINETDIGDGDDSEDGVEFDEASAGFAN